MPDYTIIDDFRIRYRAPDTESLNGQYRNNIQECMDASPLCVWRSGQQRLRATGIWTYFVQSISALPAGPSTQVMSTNRIRVPAGITKIDINIFADCNIVNANNTIRVYLAVAPGNFIEFASLPAFGAIAWTGWKTLTGLASGWDDISFDAWTYAGGGGANYRLRGYLVIPSR